MIVTAPIRAGAIKSDQTIGACNTFLKTTHQIITATETLTVEPGVFIQITANDPASGRRVITGVFKETRHEGEVIQFYGESVPARFIEGSVNVIRPGDFIQITINDPGRGRRVITDVFKETRHEGEVIQFGGESVPAHFIEGSILILRK